MPPDDDDERTPVHTPAAKRASGQHRLDIGAHKKGYVRCPKCKGTKLLCDLCNEDGEVLAAVAVEWESAHHDTDPAPKKEEP